MLELRYVILFIFTFAAILRLNLDYLAYQMIC